MNSIGSVIGRGLLVAGLLMSAGSALAAGDDGFVAFWTQFKAAIGKSDQKAVSQMLKYPFYYNDAQRQVAYFPTIWKGSFKPATRTCLAKQKPVKDTHEGKVSYYATCDDLIYSFEKDDAGWKLAYFTEND